MERLGGELLDELARHLELARAHLGLAAQVDLGEAPHLVGVVHGVEDESAVVGPEQDQMLLPAAHVLRERDLAGVAHRLREQVVGLLRALVRAEVVRPRSRWDRPRRAARTRGCRWRGWPRPRAPGAPRP